MSSFKTMSSNTKLFWCKALFCTALGLAIVFSSLDGRRVLKIYLPPNNGPIPGYVIPGPDAEIGKTSDSGTSKKSIEVPKTQPFSVLYDKGNKLLMIDPKLNTNLSALLGAGLEVTIDSPEFEYHHYAYFDTLIARGIHPNQMAPHLPFITKPAKFTLGEISKLVVGTYFGQQNVTVASDRKYMMPKQVEFDCNGNTYLNFCLFDSSSITAKEASNFNSSSNIIKNSILETSASNFSDYESEIRDSKINLGYYTKDNSFRQTTFLGSTVNGKNERTTYENCTFENSNFSNQANNTEIGNVQLVGENKMQIGAVCKINGVSGTGTLELISKFEPYEGLKRGIREYVARYGKVKSFKKELRSVVTLNNANISNFRFNPTEIFFEVDSSQDYLSKERILTQLVEYFKNNDDERKSYDIQLRKLKAQYEDNWWSTLKDVCQETWNNYGYENSRIWIIAGVVFLYLYSINLLFFRTIIVDGYVLDEFVKLYRSSTAKSVAQRFRFETSYALLYTLLLFWVFNVDWNKLRVSNLLVAFWIVLQRVVSVLLITFIVRSIFT